jgi:transketolase
MLRGLKNRVVVLMGDGEMQEGSVWEAAMLAPRLGVSNLTAIVDYNNLQGYGRPTELMHFEPVEDKWRAFGWNVVSANGHDFDEIHGALCRKFENEGPRVLILRTVKGKGVSFMENELKWHYFIVTDELLARAKEEINHA